MQEANARDQSIVDPSAIVCGAFSGVITWSQDATGRKTGRFSVATGPRNRRTHHLIRVTDPAPQLLSRLKELRPAEGVRVIGRPFQTASGTWNLGLVSIERDKLAEMPAQWMTQSTVEIAGNVGRVFGQPERAVRFGFTQPREITKKGLASFVFECRSPSERNRLRRIRKMEERHGWNLPEPVNDQTVLDRHQLDDVVYMTTPRQFARLSVCLKGQRPAELAGVGPWLKVVCWNVERCPKLYSLRVGETVVMRGRLTTREYEGREITEFQMEGLRVVKPKVSMPDVHEKFALSLRTPAVDLVATQSMESHPGGVASPEPLSHPAPNLNQPNRVSLRGKVVRIRRPGEVQDGAFRLRVQWHEGGRGRVETFTVVPAGNLAESAPVREGQFYAIEGPLTDVKRMINGEKREFPVILAERLNTCSPHSRRSPSNRIELEGIAAEVAPRACKLFVQWMESARTAGASTGKDSRGSFSVVPARRSTGFYEKTVKLDRRVYVDGVLSLDNGRPMVKARYFANFKRGENPAQVGPH